MKGNLEYLKEAAEDAKEIMSVHPELLVELRVITDGLLIQIHHTVKGRPPRLMTQIMSWQEFTSIVNLIPYKMKEMALDLMDPVNVGH